MKRWPWLLIGCVLLPLHANAQMTLEKDDIRVGDRWSFRQMDGFTNEVTSEFTRRVVAISDKDITMFEEVKGGKDKKTIFYDKEWNLLDNGLVQYSPAMKLVPHPIHVGDTWKIEYKGTTIKTGQTATCFGTGKFTSVETVTVPAGTFDAGRIEIHTECRGTDASAEVARSNTVEWNVPGVGRPIKSEYSIAMNGRVRGKSIVELTSYQRAQPDQPETQAATSNPALPAEASRPVGPSTAAPPAAQTTSPQPPLVVQQNSMASYQETLPLAEAGDANAEYRIGQMLERGIDVEKDTSKAADWFRRSAEHGIAPAMLRYGVLLRNGEGVGKDEVAGTAWIMKAAEAGNPIAQADLGLIYRAGTGLPKNIIKAREWLLKSAENGSGIGMFDLSMLSFDPNDGAADEALGREWLQKSAQTGFPRAQGVLAAKLAIGANGFAKDPAQAFDLAKSAADKDDPFGAATLGDIYSHGIGRPQDPAEAVKWYGIAARHGLAYAQIELAKAYMSGHGTEHDASQALLWAMVAAGRANDALKRLLPPLLEQAERELSPAQQEDIRQQAASWHPG